MWRIVLTGVLAVITAFYAIQTWKLVKEERRSRNREFVKKVILDVCDPLIEELDWVSQVISGARNGKFRSIFPGWRPEGGSWSDFSRENESLAEEIQAYLGFRKEYRDKYKSLESTVERKVESTRTEESNEVLYKIIEEHEISKDPVEFLEDQASGIAESILMKEVVGKGHSGEVFERWRKGWVKIREKDPVSEKIEKLSRVADEEKKEFMDRLKSELEKVRR
ncbi:hypothetical protein AKJ37_08025, partial [candidate division MSBL1 archaeon SCGC-AAA259I09]